jgi:uncharacterized membrane protein
MNRTQLDAFVTNHALGSANIDRALLLTGNRPKSVEWRAFAANSLIIAGVTATIAGLIFFIAANWQNIGLLGRFALLQTLLIACMVIAWWQAPLETAKGKQIFTLALVGATFVAGTLLALFGQSYQTGADVYELFFAWALLTLPFALAAKSDALWIIWAVVLNVGLALLCGWNGANNFGWRLFNHLQMDKAWVLMIPFAINGLGALFCVKTNDWKAPKYSNCQRFLLTLALLYGAAASLASITSYRFGHAGKVMMSGGMQEVLLLLILAVTCVALTWHTLKQKRDVYPLALIAAVSITISTALIIQIFSRSSDFGIIFFIGFWIIGTSTATGILLMRYVRAWHVVDAESAQKNISGASTI